MKKLWCMYNKSQIADSFGGRINLSKYEKKQAHKPL